jgi:hypothetical protein
MARKERVCRGKTMKPNYFVFCEGETEVAYVEILRAHYRLPIRIIAKKTLQNVTPSLVERCKAAYIQTYNDHTYLMYDLDVTTMLERLRKVKEATLLCTNPCFELWLLLHYAEANGGMTSEECVDRLTLYMKKYKKGVIGTEEKTQLMMNVVTAIRRAKNLKEYANPSTTVYLLLEDLNNLKK